MQSSRTKRDERIARRTAKAINMKCARDVLGVYTRLNYLRSLHVTVVRLCSILDSAADKDELHITNHTAVNPRLGAIDDLTLLLTTMHKYGKFRPTVYTHTCTPH